VLSGDRLELFNTDACGGVEDARLCAAGELVELFELVELVDEATAVSLAMGYHGLQCAAVLFSSVLWLFCRILKILTLIRSRSFSAVTAATAPPLAGARGASSPFLQARRYTHFSRPLLHLKMYCCTVPVLKEARGTGINDISVCCRRSVLT
jgi:hypothetical protein